MWESMIRIAGQNVGKVLQQSQGSSKSLFKVTYSKKIGYLLSNFCRWKWEILCVSENAIYKFHHFLHFLAAAFAPVDLPLT